MPSQVFKQLVHHNNSFVAKQLQQRAKSQILPQPLHQRIKPLTIAHTCQLAFYSFGAIKKCFCFSATVWEKVQKHVVSGVLTGIRLKSNGVDSWRSRPQTYPNSKKKINANKSCILLFDVAN